jgi:signal transduction histidine kinase
MPAESFGFPGAALASQVDLRERLAFLGLTGEDAARLRTLGPGFAAYADRFVEAFYAHLLAFPESSRFLRDPQLVARLKRAQRDHFASLLEAAWDEDYLERQVRVGHAHAEVGVAPQLFLGAYNQYVQNYFRELAAQAELPPAELLEVLLSLCKAIFLDIGLTLEAYFQQSTSNLRRALDLFWKANNELRQFAQLTSHDLKTPLATVANLCDEALDEFGPRMPEEARRLIAAARDRTFRMSDTISELLAASITSYGEEEGLVFRPSEVLAEAVERVRPLAEKKGIQFVLPKETPPVVGDRVRLREALGNVLSNAVKFIDRRPGRIEIGCAAAEDVCTLYIADNGPGIPPEELERVFVPFRRLPQHRDRPGSGLGLYFAKTLVEQQGGRIWAESTPGQGAKFYIQLRRSPGSPPPG